MPQSQAAGLTLSEALDDFLFDAEARRLTPATLSYYCQRLGQFISFLRDLGLIHVGEIGAQHIRRYLISLADRGLSDHSQHSAARAIRAWLNFLVREGVIETSPMDRVRMPRLRKRQPPVLDREDVLVLSRACTNARDRAIIACLLDSGCRASEYVALDVGDVNMETGEVRIRHGKGRKERVTFLGEEARQALAAYLQERGEPTSDQPLWLSQTTGTRLTHWGLRQLCKRLGRETGVEHCSPHTFRRTFATWSLQSGMDIYSLQHLMGHADITVLRHYLAFSKDDLRRAHQAHSPVDSML